jgi:excisionase family DNA binding protein
MNTASEILSPAPRTVSRTVAEPSGKPQLLSLAAVAKLVDVRDTRTIVRLLEQSEIPIIRVGRGRRVAEADIHHLLSDLRAGAHGHAERENSASLPHAPLASPDERCSEPRVSVGAET